MLAKKVEDLEYALTNERISHSSKNFNYNNNLNTTKSSICSKNTNTFSTNEDNPYECFSINSNNNECSSEENKKELDEKMNKLDAKYEIFI